MRIHDLLGGPRRAGDRHSEVSAALLRDRGGGGPTDSAG